MWCNIELSGADLALAAVSLWCNIELSVADLALAAQSQCGAILSLVELT